MDVMDVNALCADLQMNLRFIILNQLGLEDPTEWKI